MRFVRIAQAIVDGRAVDELQGLREVRVPFAFAFAGQFAGRLAEGLEERMIDFAVRQLHRTRAERHTGELLGDFGHVAQASNSCSAVRSL